MKKIFLLVVSLTISACTQTDSFLIASDVKTPKNLSTSQQLAIVGMQDFQSGELDQALYSFQKALKIDLSNSTLNLLAGLTYHKLAVSGDDSKYALAQEGYKLALRFDPSNWIASYQLGVLAMDRREFRAAQDYFAEALIFSPNDPDLLYNAATSSYYAEDVETASALLSRLQMFEAREERYLRAASIIEAASGNTQNAQLSLKQLNELGTAPINIGFLQQRIQDWDHFYERNTLSQSQIILAQSTDESTDDSGESTDDSDDTSGDTSDDTSEAVDENEMVIIDLVILRTEENTETSKGVNLLNGLTLQFGSSSSSPALSYGQSRSKTIGSITNTIVKAINIPSLDYSLNIANISETKSQVLARPTLTTTYDQAAEFFSGVSIEAATLPTTSGGSGGDSVSVSSTVGVTLGVTPTKISANRVQLLVSAERTFLNTPSANYTGFTSKLETSDTRISSTVVMNFGETLILGGLSEEEVERTDDGVPFLRDIPIIQYLFNRSTDQDFHRTVLLLITPRKPAYIYKPDEAAQMEGDEDSAMADLKARYGEWFKPLPTMLTVFEHMKETKLYREFRTGDIVIESWSEQAGFEGRMKKAMEFLYY